MFIGERQTDTQTDSMCPDWESPHNLLVHRELLWSAEPPDQGLSFGVFFFFFFSSSVTVVPISPPLPSPALPTSYIQSSPTPQRCLCPWVLFTCPLVWPFPFFPPLPPPSSLLVTVSLFFISMPLVLFLSFGVFIHRCIAEIFSCQFPILVHSCIAVHRRHVPKFIPPSLLGLDI